MIYVKDKKVERVWIGGKPVAMLLTASAKIWEAIHSCFGGGVWRAARPWRGSDKWKSF